MFLVETAADIFGEKVNFELSFPSRPSLQELNRTIESVFSTEIANTRPENVPPHTFHISKIRLYNEETSKWVQLSSESQLSNDCQLYAFQPENSWHKESQNPIPPAVKPPTRAVPAAAAAPPTGRSTLSSTPNYNTSASAAAGSSRSLPRGGAGVRSTVGSGSATLSRHSAANTTSTATALVPRAHGDVPYDEKLRIVFSEFDPKGTRSIEMEDFKQGFRSLGLDFSSATIEDLFERADTNKDRRISFTEYERFARLYPIMTDIIYIRSKAFWEEEHLNKAIQQERDTVSRAEDMLETANKSCTAAQNDVSLSKQAVLAADVELQERTERMRELAREMEEARGEKEQASKEKKEREKLLMEVKEREAGARKDLQDISRDADKIERRVTTLVADAGAADEKVRQLQKALEDAKKTADRAHHLAEQAAVEADQAREQEKEASIELETISREIPRASDAVRLAERNVSATEQVLRELDNVGKELGREADDAARRREAHELAVADAQEKADQLAREVEKARGNVDDRERQVKVRESELDEHRRQRELASQFERVLVEKELRLRETRDSLEMNESNLHSEAADFLANLRSGGNSSAAGGRSYSRDPVF